ncbi:hypothetical protein [Metabacillus niabensis]
MELYTNIFLATYLEKMEIIDIVSRFVIGVVSSSSIRTELTEM